MTVSNAEPVLAIDGLKTHFHTQDGTVHAVNGVSFKLYPGSFWELLARAVRARA